MAEISLREKTTDNLDMQLLTNGSAIDLSAVDHIEMHMIDKAGKVYRYLSTDSPAYLTIYSASEGKVRFTAPNETVFAYTRTPYKFYIEVWETVTEHYTVPEDSNAVINVLKEF